MTAGVGHFPKLDLLALQDHRVNTRKGTELAVHLRAAILAGRVRARDQFGRFVVQGSVGDESGSAPSVGDLGLGSVLVPAANATKRKIPAWFFAAPMVTAEPSRDFRPAPTITNPGQTVTRPNPQTQSRGTNADLAAQRVRVRPIGREDFSEDDRFALMDPALSPISAPLPKGWPGLMLSATDERKQRDLFFPAGGNMLCAVNAGANPETGSVVFDTDGAGALDPTRRARLQSMMRIARIGDGGIAWQLTYSDKDALDGYGLTAGRGVLSFPAETPLPPAPTSGATATGGSGTGQREATRGGTTQIGAVTDLRTLQTPARIDGQAGGVVRIDPATGKAMPAPGMTVVRGSANDPTTVRTPPADPAKIDTPRAALLSGDLVYAYMGSEKWGPLQVGAADDQHRHGTTLDGESINGGHLDPRAPFFLDAEHDAPLDFELTPYTNPSPAPERTKVHIVYDRDATHPWAGGRRRGLWRLEAEGFFRPEIVGDPNGDVFPKKPKKKEWLVVPGHGIPVTPGTRIATGGQNGFPVDKTAVLVRSEGFPVTGLAAEVARQISAGWPDADALAAPAAGGAGTGVRDGPATGPVRTPTTSGTETPLTLQGAPVSDGNEEGQKSGCYPKTQTRDKTGMGPVLKRKQYASTSQAVIFGGGTYSRAYATSKGSENLSTAVSGEKKRTPSKAEDNAPVVHHEAVIAANPSQDWCRWASTTKRTSTGLATAPGAVVSLPPDVTAASYLAGTPSPGGLTATVAHPPGYSQVAFADVHPGTGLPINGVVLAGDSSDGSLFLRGRDSTGAATGGLQIEADGTVNSIAPDGTPTPISGGGVGASAGYLRGAWQVSGESTPVRMAGFGTFTDNLAVGSVTPRYASGEDCSISGKRGGYFTNGPLNYNSAWQGNFALIPLPTGFSAFGAGGLRFRYRIQLWDATRSNDFRVYAAVPTTTLTDPIPNGGGSGWTRLTSGDVTVTADVAWTLVTVSKANLDSMGYVAGDEPIISIKQVNNAGTGGSFIYQLGGLELDLTG